MRYKLQSSTWAVTFAFLLALQLLGCCVAVQCVNNNIYADCETNFTTLENALIHTCDNAYNLWTTFFPPRETQSLFVVVKYQIINSTSSIDYIWTTAAFTLIHPPRIFGMISLFFGLVEEDRIQNVTIRLPESCQGLLTPEYGRTNEEAKSNFLEVLTQRLRLYAKFRSTGHDVIVGDVFEGKAIVFNQSAIEEIYHKRDNIGVFFSLLIVIPVILFPFLIVFVKSARAKVRTHMRNPQHHSSLAALVSLSFVFSAFVVAMDAAAVHYAYRYNNVFKIMNFSDIRPFHFLPVVLIIDGISLVIAIGVLFTLCCCGDNPLRCCIRFWLCGIFCCQSFSEEESCRSDCDCCKNPFSHCKYICCKKAPQIESCLLGCFCCRCKDCSCCEKSFSQAEGGNKNEQKVWLLTVTFVSSFVSFGTHFPYIIIAWIEYPDHAAAIAIMYALSFLYYFVTFRYLYQFLPNNLADLCSCCRRCCGSSGCCSCGYCGSCRCCGSSGSSVESPADEMAECNRAEMEGFKIWKVLVMVGIGLVLAGFEIWFIAGFVQLPVAQIIDDAPKYIYAFFQTMLIVLSGLLTYKLLTFHVTDTSTFFTTMIKACKHLSIKSDKPKPVSDVERAAVLLGVIVHQNSNSTPAGTNGEASNNDANKLWNDIVSN